MNDAAGVASAYTHGTELSVSFEHEMVADAEARDDYRTLHARNIVSLSDVGVVLYRRGSAPHFTAAEDADPALFPALLSIEAVDFASTPSGSNALQSEVHSTVPSNFAASQHVAQPAAQLASQSSAQLAQLHPAVQQSVSNSSVASPRR